MSKHGFILALTAILALFLLIMSGVVYQFIYPTPKETPQDHFIDSCERIHGVPDVHTNEWRCIR